MATHDSVFHDAQDALQSFQERQQAMRSAVEQLQMARAAVDAEIGSLESIRDTMDTELKAMFALFGGGSLEVKGGASNHVETVQVEGDAAQTSKVMSEREETAAKDEQQEADKGDSKPRRTNRRKTAAAKDTKPVETKPAPAEDMNAANAVSVDPETDIDPFARLETPDNPADIDDELWSGELDFPDEDEDSLGTSDDLNHIKF